MDRPPFDAIRACFWLIAAILAVQCLVALVGLFACMYWSASIIEGRTTWTCENINATLNQLLTGALAAALAFAAGFVRKDK
jgi:hypothetical protein